MPHTGGPSTCPELVLEDITFKMGLKILVQMPHTKPMLSLGENLCHSWNKTLKKKKI
jgi:hypothetical protein